MTESRIPTESEQLIGEIVGYLGAVELFRALGCEPSWRSEGSSQAPAGETACRLAEKALRERHIPPPRFTV